MEEELEISRVDIALGFESALKTVDDLENVCNIYDTVINTESRDIIKHYMGMLYTDEEINTESAIKGKDGFVGKLKNLINK